MRLSIQLGPWLDPAEFSVPVIRKPLLEEIGIQTLPILEHRRSSIGFERAVQRDMQKSFKQRRDAELLGHPTCDSGSQQGGITRQIKRYQVQFLALQQFVMVQGHNERDKSVGGRTIGIAF